MNVRTACPVDPAHGRVLDAPGERWAFYCPSQVHDGRPSTHPLGSTPATRAYFTTTEVERGSIDPLYPSPASRTSVADLAGPAGGPTSRDARRTSEAPGSQRDASLSEPVAGTPQPAAGSPTTAASPA